MFESRLCVKGEKGETEKSGQQDNKTARKYELE